MKNSLTYSIPFAFKGEIFRPSCSIDLDEQVKLGGLPCLYRHLANDNRIDVYSHEYDVMMMGDIEFLEAEGLAAEFMQSDHFDFDGFQRAWNEAELMRELEAIAVEYLDIDSIDGIKGLDRTLLEVFKKGQHENER